MLARAMNHPASCHGLSKDRARYECFAELMGQQFRDNPCTTEHPAYFSEQISKLVLHSVSRVE